MNRAESDTPGRARLSRTQLVFGLIALQNNFVTREQLVHAFDSWVQDKSRSIGDILEKQGALESAQRDVLQRLVEIFIAKHGGDAEQSLASLAVAPLVRPELERLNDSDLSASLDQVGKDVGPDSRLQETIPATNGVTLGRFRILRPHAKGGLGQVSVALDQELNREVALKQLLPQRADDIASRDRFLREAEITGGLEHPGIIPVYGLGDGPDGRPYYAMRFVQGYSFKQAIEAFHHVDHPSRKLVGARQLALSQLLGRFIDVCNAMEYAHSRGVLHRDLKPANIMVGRFGEAIIVDWGLAKPLGIDEEQSDESALKPTSALSSTAQTQPGSAIGTPAYMSPEQAEGRLDELTRATDVYSLGATLYHLLTGQPPFDSQDVANNLKKVQEGDFRNPRDVNADVNPALQAICLKAMALNPTDRYRSAEELADDVNRWLANEPIFAGIFHQTRQRLAAELERSLRPEAREIPHHVTAGDELQPSTAIQSDDTQPAAKLEPGSAEYQISNLIGAGGMGEVYQARQVSLDRDVAVKFLKSRELDATSKTRYSEFEARRIEQAMQRRDREWFLTEAIITANLEHPHIIPIYDVFQDVDGKLCYSMKWARGISWTNLLRSQRKSESEHLEILQKVADAIAFANENGIIHRDLKPENVIVGTNGEVYVMDWGAALVKPNFERSSNFLNPSSGFGSVLYAAPELFLGTVNEITVRSDVYLLGATLYEIISGSPPHPYPRTKSEALDNLRGNAIVPSAYQGELLEIALKAMATNPSDRYATVKEFQAAIRETQQHASSRVLSTYTRPSFAKAVKSGSYPECQKAIIAYDLALKLWPGNNEARKGLRLAKLVCGADALKRGDYAAGLAVAESVDRMDTETVAHLRYGLRAASQPIGFNRRIGWGEAGMALSVAIVADSAALALAVRRSLRIDDLLPAILIALPLSGVISLVFMRVLGNVIRRMREVRHASRALSRFREMANKEMISTWRAAIDRQSVLGSETIDQRPHSAETLRPEWDDLTPSKPARSEPETPVLSQNDSVVLSPASSMPGIFSPDQDTPIAEPDGTVVEARPGGNAEKEAPIQSMEFQTQDSPTSPGEPSQSERRSGMIEPPKRRVERLGGGPI